MGLAPNGRSWSPDGKVVLYVVQSTKSGLDLWALPVAGGDKPMAVAQTPFSETDGQRFLVSKAMSAGLPITIVLNWKPPAPKDDRKDS